MSDNIEKGSLELGISSFKEGDLILRLGNWEMETSLVFSMGATADDPELLSQQRALLEELVRGYESSVTPRKPVMTGNVTITEAGKVPPPPKVDVLPNKVVAEGLVPLDRLDRDSFHGISERIRSIKSDYIHGSSSESRGISFFWICVIFGFLAGCSAGFLLTAISLDYFFGR